MQSMALMDSVSMKVATTILNHPFPFTLPLSGVMRSLSIMTTNFDTVYLLPFSLSGVFTIVGPQSSERNRHKVVILLDLKFRGPTAVSTTSPTWSEEESSKLGWWGADIGQVDTQLDKGIGSSCIWEAEIGSDTLSIGEGGLHQNNPPKAHGFQE